MRSLRLIFLVFGIVMFSADPLFADGQGGIPIPDGLIYTAIVIGLVFAGLVSAGFSFLMKKLYEFSRQETRKTVLWMSLFTLALPALYLYLEGEYHLLKGGAGNSGSEIRQILYPLVVGLLVFAGFNAGYFMTPVKSKLPLPDKSMRKKVEAVLIPAVVWLILIGFPFYLAIRPIMDRNKANRVAELQELKRDRPGMKELKKALEENYSRVRWVKPLRRYNAIDKDGNKVVAGFDSIPGKFSVSTMLEKSPPAMDTLAWLDYAERLRNFLSPERAGILEKEIEEKKYSIFVQNEYSNFAVEIYFPESEAELVYASHLRLLILRWYP